MSCRSLAVAHSNEFMVQKLWGICLGWAGGSEIALGVVDDGSWGVGIVAGFSFVKKCFWIWIGGCVGGFLMELLRGICIVGQIGLQNRKMGILEGGVMRTLLIE